MPDAEEKVQGRALDPRRCLPVWTNHGLARNFNDTPFPAACLWLARKKHVPMFVMEFRYSR
jgi:hypothetical protein